MMTDAEKMARAIAAGDNGAFIQLREWVLNDSRPQFLPVFFSFRRLWKVEGRQVEIANCAISLIRELAQPKNRAAHPSEIGNLLTIIALHSPNRLAGIIETLWSETNQQTEIYEAMITLHSVLYD